MMPNTNEEQRRESILVLEEAMRLQERKSHDYQNSTSRVHQADHYRCGINTIHDMIHQKVLRAQSLLEAAESGVVPNHESIEDTYIDLINYASFAVSYLRGKMDGQKETHDAFNREKQ